MPGITRNQVLSMDGALIHENCLINDKKLIAKLMSNKFDILFTHRNSFK